VTRKYTRTAILPEAQCQFCQITFTPRIHNQLCCRRHACVYAQCKALREAYQTAHRAPGKLCRGCGVLFCVPLHVSGRREFCDHACRESHVSRENKKRLAALKQQSPVFRKPCTFCGCEFQTGNANSHTCNHVACQSKRIVSNVRAQRRREADREFLKLEEDLHERFKANASLRDASVSVGSP
jgi:hypothetical protein